VESHDRLTRCLHRGLGITYPAPPSSIANLHRESRFAGADTLLMNLLICPYFIVSTSTLESSSSHPLLPTSIPSLSHRPTYRLPAEQGQTSPRGRLLYHLIVIVDTIVVHVRWMRGRALAACSSADIISSEALPVRPALA